MTQSSLSFRQLGRILFSLAGASMGLTSAVASAATPWLLPELLWGQEGGGWSGPGFYFSILKIVAFLIVYLLWVAIGDWINQDVQRLDLDHNLWNGLYFFSFVAAFFLFLLIPFFPVGYLLVCLATFVPALIYASHRNKKVSIEDRVLTAAHFKKIIGRLSGKEVKVAVSPDDLPPPIRFDPIAKTQQEKNLRLIPARQHPGYQSAREFIAEALDRRGEAIDMMVAPTSTTLRYMIDGVWINMPPVPPESAMAAVEVLKILCGLNPQDRTSRQQGKLDLRYHDVPLSLTFASQGVAGGERVVIQFSEKTSRFRKLEDLGMRPKLQETIKNFLNAPQGIIVFSAPPGHGLTTTVTCAILSGDRFSREWISIEDEQKTYEVIENVQPYIITAQDRQNLDGFLDKVFHMEPNVVVCRDLPNGKVLQRLAEETENNRLVITTVRAKDCCEALLKLMALQPPAKAFPEKVIGVVNQRVMRRLCDKCRQPYPPPPELLQRLGIPPGRIQAFFRPHVPTPEEKEVCPQCQGLGYFGRCAVFEVLVVNDNLRKILGRQPDYATLRKAARAAGMATLQEEGVLLLAQGITSYEELARVLQG
jgi:type II secretory ATPase GspE/PulE/Tfp pilus assembly ATPase PilB-like protein